MKAIHGAKAKGDRIDSQKIAVLARGGLMPAFARRTFLSSLAASVAAPAILQSQTRPKRLPIAFSTLGCPLWSWKAILENADRLGYSGLELRGIARRRHVRPCKLVS